MSFHSYKKGALHTLLLIISAQCPLTRQPKEESRLKIDGSVNNPAPGGAVERYGESCVAPNASCAETRASSSPSPGNGANLGDVASSGAAPLQVTLPKSSSTPPLETDNAKDMASAGEVGGAKSKHRQLLEEAAASGRVFVPQKCKAPGVYVLFSFHFPFQI